MSRSPPIAPRSTGTSSTRWRRSRRRSASASASTVREVRSRADMSDVDPELARLFAAERGYEEAPPPGAPARVLAAVHAKVGGGGGGGGPGGRTMPLSRAIGGMVATAAIGAVVGG